MKPPVEISQIASTGYDGLHVLLDDDPRWGRDPVAQAESLRGAGAAVFQLRAKQSTDQEALDFARELRRITREDGTRLVVNDRFDLALACEADAVHLGQDDLPPEAIPQAVRLRLAIGRSTHDRKQALRAAAEGAAYIAFGPLFGTQSKDTPFAARGLEALRQIVVDVAPIPVVAIGGIDASRTRAIRETGARGIAVISAVANDPAPRLRARELARGLRGARP
jgi:thiamine-phosphate pyrophosphorylase